MQLKQKIMINIMTKEAFITEGAITVTGREKTIFSEEGFYLNDLTVWDGNTSHIYFPDRSHI